MSALSRHERKKRTVRLWVIVAVIVVFFVCVMLTTAIITVLRGIHEQVEVPPGEEEVPIAEPGERVNVLFLGIDDEQGGPARSDTVMVISYNPVDGNVSLLSIPRDSRVKIPQRGLDKMGHAHAYGGPRLAMQTVEQLLRIPIHYYVRTDLDGFAQIVDILGGVEIDVPTRMYYEDEYQDLVIDLMPGVQILDGDKALQFVRYRGYHDADFGRIRAQQVFLSALMERMLQVRTIFKLPAIATQVARHVDTNMTPREIIKFASWAMNVCADQLTMEMLPGEPAYIEQNGQLVSYVVLDDRVVAEYSQRLFGDETASVSVIRVEIYNGSGRTGLARSLADMLPDEYEVVSLANADRSDYQHTFVVAGEGREDEAERVIATLKSLGIAAELSTDYVPQSGAEVRIVIGLDFPQQ